MLHTWADTKRDADALQKSEKQKLGRKFLEGTAQRGSSLRLISRYGLQIPIGFMSKLTNLYQDKIAFLLFTVSLEVVKLTAVLQSMLRKLNETPDKPLYEIASDTISLNSVLGLIGRIHRDEHVIIYIPDMFTFVDSMLEDLTSFGKGQFTVISSARSGEWRDHITDELAILHTPFSISDFNEVDYAPLIQRLLEYVPAPRFLQMGPAARVQKLRSSKSQLLIALKETTESANFTDVITPGIRTTSG